MSAQNLNDHVASSDGKMPQEKAIQLRICEVSIAIASMIAVVWGINLFVFNDPLEWGRYKWGILGVVIIGLIAITNSLKERYVVVVKTRWESKHLPMLVVLFVCLLFSGLMFGVCLDAKHQVISGIETLIMIIFGAWGLTAERNVDEQRNFECLQAEMPSILASYAKATKARAWNLFLGIRPSLGNFMTDQEAESHINRLFDASLAKSQIDENLVEFEELLQHGVQVIAGIENKRLADTKKRIEEEKLPPDVIEEQQEWKKGANA